MLHSQQIYIHQLLGQLAAADPDPDGEMLESEGVTPEPMPVPEDNEPGSTDTTPAQAVDSGADAAGSGLQQPRPSSDV